MFSSIKPIHLNESLQEIHRRLISIPFSKADDLPEYDHTLIDFSGLDESFKDFWENDERCERYVSQIRSGMRSTRKLVKQLDGTGTEKIALCMAVAQTGILHGYFQDLIEFYEALEQCAIAARDKASSQCLDQHAEAIIRAYTTNVDGAKYIDHDLMRFALGNARKNELTEIKMVAVKQVLRYRGYVLETYKNKPTWIKR